MGSEKSRNQRNAETPKSHSQKNNLKNLTIQLNICKDHKILKFTDILKVPNCLFMYHVEQNSALATFSTAETNTISRPDLPPKTC